MSDWKRGGSQQPPFIMDPDGNVMPYFDVKGPSNGYAGPQYAGNRVGLSLDEMQRFNKNALKTKGYYVTVPAGDSGYIVDTKIPSNGWFLCGFRVHAVTNFEDEASWPKSFSVMLNNELILENNAWADGEAKYLTGQMYYQFPRFLEGVDELTFKVDNSEKDEQAITLTWFYR